MADTYIDYFEVSEYGNYFVGRAATLIGASPMVDVAALQGRVNAAVAAVDVELEKAGVSRTGARGGGGAATELAARLRDVIERFYFHLRSLPATTQLDFEAFFPKRNLGNLSQLKPGDILAKGGAVLRGFASNATLPGVADWKTELTTAHQALAQALDGAGGAKVDSINATASLQTARENFLTLYNRVAKRLIKGVLIDLDREREYRLFFLDLQVNEDGTPADPDAPTDPSPGADADTGADAP